MSSGFVSEKVIEEKRLERQKEWEKVRKKTDPKLAPEEPVETRSLYEQLNQNRMKAQEEWEESNKLKNQIRGIDDDEAEFLDTVDDIKIRIERERHLEEKKYIEDFRKAQQLKESDDIDEAIKEEILGKSKSTKKSDSITKIKSSKSQSKLLIGAVKRKTSNSDLKESDQPEEKTCKKDDDNKKPLLGALAGLGAEYDSSSDDEEN